LLVVAWVMRQNFLDLEHYNWKLVQIITNLKCVRSPHQEYCPFPI
jgi:hypothetical protein